MAGKKVFMKPKDDSYESFRNFVLGFAAALGGDFSLEGWTDEDEQKMRETYAAYLAARANSGASKESGR
jgi:hypothetical protein